ncbi:MAG: DUF3489 domain-containing protein [Rhizobiaceae bacterium]|nr:DUF3489 domain-containing protein [Rhizobiaceae bacterium]
MAKFKLTDIHKLILSAAATRPDGNLLPPPEGLGELSEMLRTSYGELLQHKFAMEVETGDQTQVWRTGEGKTFGLIITDKGKAVAGEVQPPAAKPVKKIDMVLNMLRREQGATLAELVDATGWLPHTTRAALTGLRKKGHILEKATRDGATCYAIMAVA